MKQAHSSEFEWQLRGFLFLVLNIVFMILVLNKIDTQVRVVKVEIPVPYTVEQPVIIEKVPYQVNSWFTSDDLYYLAEAIYFESSIESLECQAQVGFTIMNRVKKRNKSIKEVIWAGSQFSYTQDGKHERMTNTPARERAFAVARLVLNRHAIDKTDGGQYFVNLSIVPNWKYKNIFQKTIKCDNHTYFKE